MGKCKRKGTKLFPRNFLPFYLSSILKFRHYTNKFEGGGSVNEVSSEKNTRRDKGNDGVYCQYGNIK